MTFTVGCDMKLVPPKASASGHVSSDSVVVERHLFPQLGRLVLWMTPAVVLVNDLHEAAFSLHYPTASQSALQCAPLTPLSSPSPRPTRPGEPSRPRWWWAPSMAKEAPSIGSPWP